MQVPAKDHPIWKALITGQKHVDLSFLAAKIMIARLRLGVQANPASAANGAGELWAIYANNSQLSSVQKDLASFGA